MLFPGDCEPKDLLLEKMRETSEAQEQRERGCSASRETAAAGSQDMQKMRNTVCNRSRGQAILLRQVQIWERAKSVTRGHTDGGTLRQQHMETMTVIHHGMMIQMIRFSSSMQTSYGQMLLIE